MIAVLRVEKLARGLSSNPRRVQHHNSSIEVLELDFQLAGLPVLSSTFKEKTSTL